MEADKLKALRQRLKSGEYDGADVMCAWLAIDELLTLRSSLSAAEKERQELKKRLEWSEQTNNFDATRLRRLATLCGASVPESDETLLGCAGTVIGSICRQVELSFAKTADARHEGRMEALNAVFQINGPSRAIARLKEKYGAERAAKEMEG